MNTPSCLPMSPESAYRRANSDSTESAGRRLVRVYQLAIEAADQRQPAGVRQCLDLLRHTLDPSANPEVAVSLASVYADCDKLLQAEQYGDLIEILETVKTLWEARLRIDTMMPR